MMHTASLSLAITSMLMVSFLSLLLAWCNYGSKSENTKPNEANWKTYRDDQNGFSLRYPPDWQSTTSEERCVQLQKGKSELPEGVEVDIFLRVQPLQGNFPADYLKENEGAGSNQGVTYRERHVLSLNGLSAVHARFQSSGPTPNWGIEYAIRKGNQIVDVYISQPKPDIEVLSEGVVRTLQW